MTYMYDTSVFYEKCLNITKKATIKKKANNKQCLISDDIRKEQNTNNFNAFCFLMEIHSIIMK